MTGLRPGQLTELAARVAAAIGDVVRPGGSPAVIGLYRSAAMVVTLMRTNGITALTAKPPRAGRGRARRSDRPDGDGRGESNAKRPQLGARGEQLALIDNRDPFAPPVWRSPVYRTRKR